MSTRLVLRLVVADHLSLDRRQKIRSLLGRAVRDGITKLIETRRLEIGEVLVAGEFLTEEITDSKRGHRTSQKAYVTDGKADRGAAVKRDTTKRYPQNGNGSASLQLAAANARLEALQEARSQLAGLDEYEVAGVDEWLEREIAKLKPSESARAK